MLWISGGMLLAQVAAVVQVVAVLVGAVAVDGLAVAQSVAVCKVGLRMARHMHADVA